jgi:hypothetical protein
MFRKLRQLSPIARAIGVMGAVTVLVTGVTFAALSSTATLSGNTLSAADSNLLVWDQPAGAFESDAPGFNVTDLIPGEGSGENFFYLQNNGDGAVHVSAHVPTAPAEPEGGYGFSGWDNLKLTFKSYAPDCEDNTLNTTMEALLAGNVTLPCNTLAKDATGNNQPGQEATEGNYSVKFDIDPSSLTEGATDAGVGSFDLQLIGSLTAPVPTT